MTTTSRSAFCLCWLFVLNGLLAAQNSMDFSKQGRPFLEKYCLQCHGTQDIQAELTLDPYRDNTSIVKKRKTWDNVLRMVASGEMPPSDKPRPTVAEAEAFQNLVRAIFAEADRNAKPDPGRVTMRRLNRTEYRNTIRDLIGIDFDPTQDFPSDDIGHGFDNIGDVLTLSPVLMERYMAAAEGILHRAIVPDPPKPTKRHLGAEHTEPASGNAVKKLMEGKFRRLASDAEASIETGPIHTSYQWVADGEYQFRSRMYAKTDGSEPVKIAILIEGKGLTESSTKEELSRLVGKVREPSKIVAIAEVAGRSPESADKIEVTLPPMAGRDRVMIALCKPSDDAPPVQLFVEHMALEGPMDMRPASHRRLLDVEGQPSTEERTRMVLSRFLRKAYRRPPTEEEKKRLEKLVSEQMADGAKWESAMQMAFQAILCSPKFLFRVELDDRPESQTPRELDPFHVASRLSYFIWSSLPDDELLDLANAGSLNEKLEEQVRRMLKDPKSNALVSNFAMQWLQVQRIATYAPDAQKFPQFNDRLRTAMIKETEMFFDSVIREDRSLLELIDADYTFLNEPLARLYGIEDTNGNWIGQKSDRPKGDRIRGEAFQRVSLQGQTRGGLLTQASILAATSNPTRTSPVKRGRWVLEQILGAPPPPPPPNVPELPEGDHVETKASLKVRLEAHRKNPSCANCHAKMDPIGFALENYDAIGAFRTKDGEFDVDPSGAFADGTIVQGPEGLKQVIRARKREFARCITEKLLIYAIGRGLEYYDQPAIEKILKELERSDYKFSVLMTQIVQSDPFRKRRAADLTP